MVKHKAAKVELTKNDKLAAYKAAAEELNSALKLEPPIQISDDLEALSAELKETADILHPSDVFSGPTMAVLAELGTLPASPESPTNEDEDDGEENTFPLMPGDDPAEAPQTPAPAPRASKPSVETQTKGKRGPKPGAKRGPRNSTGERKTGTNGKPTLTSFINERLLEGIDLKELAVLVQARAAELGVKALGVGQLRAHIHYLNTHGKFSVKVSESGFAQAVRLTNPAPSVVE